MAPLVHIVTDGVEDKPFGQFWALEALQQTLERNASDPAVLKEIEPKLGAYLSRLPVGTDRWRVVREIVEVIRKTLGTTHDK